MVCFLVNKNNKNETHSFQRSRYYNSKSLNIIATCKIFLFGRTKLAHPQTYKNRPKAINLASHFCRFQSYYRPQVGWLTRETTWIHNKIILISLLDDHVLLIYLWPWILVLTHKLGSFFFKKGNHLTASFNCLVGLVVLDTTATLEVLGSIPGSSKKC